MTKQADDEKPRKVSKTDPTLLLAAKLDRIMAEIKPAPMRHWALAYLNAKYNRLIDDETGEELPL